MQSRPSAGGRRGVGDRNLTVPMSRQVASVDNQKIAAPLSAEHRGSIATRRRG
jgi:hypothetical protein